MTYLAVVHGEVEMVQRMVRRAVDDRLERVSGDHVRVVDEDGPAVNDHEEAEVQLAVEGEEVDDEVVRDGLGVSVERMERVRCEGRRDCGRHDQYRGRSKCEKQV